MPFGSLSLTMGLSPTPAASAAVVELFPDPTLADVADNVNGWEFSDVGMGPAGGTGPGITAIASTTGDSGGLAAGGTDYTALVASLSPTTAYSVAITFASVSVVEDLGVVLGASAPATFTPSNGVVTHDITTSAAPGDNAFGMTPLGGGGTYNITHISVTAT